MIKNIWVVVCRESIINQDDNSISLLGSFDDLNVNIDPRFPLEEALKQNKDFFVAFPFEVVCLWERKGESKDENPLIMEMALKDPDGKELRKNTNELVFPPIKRRLRTRTKIDGVPFTKVGVYSITVNLKQGSTPLKLIHEAEFNVNLTRNKIPQNK